MRRFAVLFSILLSGLISSVHAQGTSVVSQTFLQATGEGDTAYLIATAPASSTSTYDHLHLVATLDCSYYAGCDSTIDLMAGNRSGFHVVYTAKGYNPVGMGTHIVAYQQGGNTGPVNFYVVLPNNWVTATYTILENIEETVYSSPTAIDIDTNPLSGTLIFDTNSASYPPQNYTDFAGDFFPSGSLGIGTTSPFAPLSVGSSGQFQVSSTGAVSAPSLSLATALPVASGGTGAATLTGLVKGNGSSAFTAAVAGSDYQAPMTLTTTGTGVVATLSNNVLYIPQSANTTSANTWTGAQTFGSSVNFPGNGQWNASGNVGIGAAAPTAPIQAYIGGSGVLQFGSSFLGSNIQSTDGWERYMLSYGVYWDPVNQDYVLPDTAFNQASFSDDNGNFVWTMHQNALSGPLTYAQWHAYDVMTLNNVGQLGIGTQPSQRLEVNGNVKVDGNIILSGNIVFPDGTQSEPWAGTCTATGGDYAESVDVTGDKSEYEPGDVVVLDPTNPGRFLLSSEPYSTLVAGIYSTKPGYVGRRQKGDPKLAKAEIPMAMVGIVPTKVTTENGPIKVGDLLVTSTKVGYVMKGTDRSQMIGAVVGKAMGPLEAVIDFIPFE